MKVFGKIQFGNELASPVTPATGTVHTFSKAGTKNVFRKDDAGFEQMMGNQPKTVVAAGEQLTIETNYQYLVYNTFTVTGTVVSNGDLVIL